MTLAAESRAVMGCSLNLDSSLLRTWMSHLFRLRAAGRFRPHIDARLALDEAADAHRLIQDRKYIGKVLLIP